MFIISVDWDFWLKSLGVQTNQVQKVFKPTTEKFFFFGTSIIYSQQWGKWTLYTAINGWQPYPISIKKPHCYRNSDKLSAAYAPPVEWKGLVTVYCYLPSHGLAKSYGLVELEHNVELSNRSPKYTNISNTLGIFTQMNLFSILE